MGKFRPVTYTGSAVYVIDTHYLSDRALAVLLRATKKNPDDFIKGLENAGGLVVIDHKVVGDSPEPLAPLLYLAKYARDDERIIKHNDEPDRVDEAISFCECVLLGDIVRSVKENIKTEDPMKWFMDCCVKGLQDPTIRMESYKTRDMRSKGIY